MNRQVTGKICLIPITRFCYLKFFLIYFTIIGVRKLVWYIVYQGLHCVEVHFIEVSLYSSHREISGITSHPPSPPPNFLSGNQVKLSHFPREILSFKNVNLSLLDFLFNDPSSLCVPTSHHPHPKKKKRMGGSPLASFPFLEARGGGGGGVGAGGEGEDVTSRESRETRQPALLHACLKNVDNHNKNLFLQLKP